jgi:predicted 3-demethylubiquinone-9 3-methyltransferase (glyoxalase superfamily)
VDALWDQLGDGGQPNRCGWLTDKFGVSWQIVPTVLGEMLQDKDPERARRVMQAMLQMQKLDIAQLKAAYEQG